MKKILDIIAKEVKKSFEACGYDPIYAKTTLSNRPDLCEYQCNGALAAAKVYKKAPIMIAGEVAAGLSSSQLFAQAEAVMPGFINLKLSDEFLVNYLEEMKSDERLGCDQAENAQTIVIDYGGANVAKPLHVGHLRSAIIGESIKRIGKFLGHHVIGDVHLGDWGLQMGLIIIELKSRQPKLIYFDDSYDGEYPKEPPFTISELEEIYPAASAKSKENEDFKEEAKTATFLLQNGHKGYLALWNHILAVSIADLKKNYDSLNVHFDLWKKESDAQPYIPDMVQYMKDEGYAHISEGALVVDVQEETDTREIPPCMILKSDGATLYNTTDLATIVERMELFSPDHIIYVVDKRQELYFEQVFRCARKTKLVKEDTKLTYLGFGTMNGKDGKPFKTREGGIMRLETLVSNINEQVYQKIMENPDVSEEEAKETARKVGLAALKYGDLSNQASKDYVFDMERFTSFEGNTGPYVLYTIVRIKSILAKYEALDDKQTGPHKLLPPAGESEKTLMLELTRFNEIVESSFAEAAPHKVCQYIYELSNAFSRFYHETKIITEEDKNRQSGWIALIILVKAVLMECIGLLGIEAPDRM